MRRLKMSKKKIMAWLLGLVAVACVGSENLLTANANAQGRILGRGVRIYANPGYSAYRSVRPYNYGYTRPYSYNYVQPYSSRYAQPYYGYGYRTPYRSYYQPNYYNYGVPSYGFGNGIQIQLGGRAY
jgi:hypothetical protein